MKMRNGRVFRTVTAFVLSIMVACVPVLAQMPGASALAAEGAADKTALNDILAKAEALDTSGKTQKSAALFKASIQTAKETSAKANASQAEVDRQVTLLEKTSASLIDQKDGTMSDGTYNVTGRLRHATSDQNSMGNAAIRQPMKLVVSGGEMTLKLESVAMTSSLGKTKFTGYMGRLSYFPGYTNMKKMPSSSQTKYSVPVDSYYNVYDSYNDPKTGTDKVMKGKKYPHVYSMPVSFNQESYWVEVYVPVMEGIMAGSGTQFAILEADWSTAQRTDGQRIDRSKLKSEISKLNKIKAAFGSRLKGKYTSAQQDLAAKAVAAGNEALTDLDMAQQDVDAVQAAMTAVKGVFGLSDSEIEKLASSQSSGKTDGSSSGSSGSKSGSKKSGSKKSGSKKSGKKSGSSKKLDIRDLADGVYVIRGEMVKIDRSSYSMSNGAISHNIKLTVKNGKYKLGMTFFGIKVSGQEGYLGTLKYFKSGYGTDSYGAPTGSTGAATVLEKHSGTDYPKKVEFPMIKEARNDGYVPLQVFVPVMESISAGTGTQPVYLHLKFDTLKKADMNTNFDVQDQEGGTSSPGAGGSSGGSGISGSSLSGGGLKPSSSAGANKPAGSTGLTAGAGAEQVSVDDAAAASDEDKVPPLRKHAKGAAGGSGVLLLAILLFVKRKVLLGAFLS